MIRWILKLILNAGVFLGVSQFLPGFHVNDFRVAFIASVVFGLVNGVVKPVLKLISLPLTLMTLGLFSFIINAGMMALAAWLVPGFMIATFKAALLGWLCVAIGTSVVGWLLKKD
jgi:putative membrane protein